MIQTLTKEQNSNADTGINQPKFQAVCFLVGRLHQENGKFTALESLHGLIQVSGVRKQCKEWLEKHPDSDSGLWAVYPRTDRDGRIRSVFVASRRSALPENYATVRISGQIAWVDDSKIVLRIHRNTEPSDKTLKAHPSWKPFLLTVTGFLSDCKPGEHWDLECDVESGCIVLVDGQKLKDAPRQTKHDTTKKTKLKQQRGKIRDTEKPCKLEVVG